MKLRLPLFAFFSLSAAAQTVDIGSGPVSETIRREFLRSYYRGSFQTLTTLPPVGEVRRLGATGLVQEFNAATGGTANNPLRYALVRANSLDSTVVEGADTVLQMSPALYTYLLSVGVNTAGYPTTDTATCPSIAAYVCTYQLFDKNFALFVFTAGNQNGTKFDVKDPFFTRWRQVGIGALGPVIGAEETAVASGAATGATATVQRFALGALYNNTAGPLTGRLLLVSDPIYSLYAANRAEAGFLGMPTSEVQTLATGRRRQTFEGGAIEYDLGQTPELRLPVGSVIVSGSATTDRLNLGDTVTLRAQTFSGNGSPLEGRAISWVTTNSRVLAIEQSTGQTTVVRAVGGGSANISAVSEGRASRALTFFVTAPCCQIGEGAPTLAIQQSFADAVTRNRLNVRVPSPSSVRRVGTGFVQELAPADPNSTARYLLARSDAGSNTFLVTGNTLVKYLELGGPAGPLGYPLADASAAGRQVFAAGALGGNPVQLVVTPILTRWQQQNYEAGPAGLPRGAVEQVLSFTATLGVAQAFTGGTYVAHLTGSLANRAFLVSGLALAKYQSLGGAAGQLGLPTGDEFTTSGRRRQDFEGGLITYAPGDAEATLEERQRRPQISATPGTVAAGSRIRLAAGGFEQGATLRITVGNQPDFVVQTQTGAFAWELFVPADAPSGLVNLRAADVNNTRALAVSSYVVQSGAEVLTDVTIASGNLQSGVPGARLPQPLEVLVTDENKVPLVGVPVRWDASPGAQIEAASALTDERGRARAFLRLALAESPALATAASGRDVVTFAATSRAGALPNFPRLNQTGLAGDPNLGSESVKIADAGALLVSAASMLRYYQGTGELGSPNGPADPPLLNTFLRDLCVFDAQGVRVCDGFIGRPGGAGEKNVNLWRLAPFFNGSLDIVNVPLTATAGVNAIRDALGQNAPVLLALALGSETGAEVAHFLVAIGVSSTGEILVHDPNPALRRSTLGEYLQRPRTRLAAALRFSPQVASALGFLMVTGAAETEVASPAGACGFSVAWPAPGTSAAGAGLLRFRYCDGQQGSYQMTLSGSGDEPFVLTDLGTVAGRFAANASLPGTFALTRPASNWTVAAQQAAFSAASVLNAATFTPALSPGALATVFGSGLALPGRATRVFLDGDESVVLAATPFQVNFQIPPSAQPGGHTLRIESPFGAAEQIIQLEAVSPAIFTLGGGRGAIVNQDGVVNTVSSPARRGSIIVVYGTGFGALRPQGNLQVTSEPVTGQIEGAPLQTLYAGAAPGFPGLYQINLSLPTSIPPGLTVRLTLASQGVQSQPVVLAIQ